MALDGEQPDLGTLDEQTRLSVERVRAGRIDPDTAPPEFLEWAAEQARRSMRAVRERRQAGQPAQR